MGADRRRFLRIAGLVGLSVEKDGSRFKLKRFIETGMADIHSRIVAAGYFWGSGPDGSAEGVGPALGDVNHVHPFREGNGRAQLGNLKQLAARAGYAIDLTRPRRARHATTGTPARAADLRVRGRPPAVTTIDDSLTLEPPVINANGLSDLDHRYLRTPTDRRGGSPAGLATLVTAIGEPADALQDRVETYLIQ